MRRWVPGRTGHEDGISLVEVLVGVTLLAVTMAATASSVARSLQVARDSRESVIAANVVQYELERLRSIPFVDWVTSATSGGTSTATERFEGPDGQGYEVTREAVWVQAGASGDGCQTAGAGGDADYVRVTQTVAFPGRDIDPVTNVTIITPRLEFFDPYTGNLAIRVRDRDGVGAPGHTVQIDGSAGLEVAVTDANGCAFFPYLPVDVDRPASNGYDVRIATADHVSVEGAAPVIEDTVVITAQTTTVREYVYDEAAVVEPVPTTRPPVAGCTLVLVDTGFAPGAGDPSMRPTDPAAPGVTATLEALECRTGGAPTPAGWRATIPINLGWLLHNGASSFSPTGWEVHDPSTTTVRPREVDGLFPYLAGYGIHAGRCTTADPATLGGSRTTAPAEPGQREVVAVQMGLVTVTTWDGADPGGVLAPGQDVFADMPASPSCPAGERLYLGRSGAGATLTALLPFGDWVIHFTAPGQLPPTQPYDCGEVRATSCVHVRPDFTTTQDALTGYDVAAVANP